MFINFLLIFVEIFAKTHRMQPICKYIEYSKYKVQSLIAKTNLYLHNTVFLHYVYVYKNTNLHKYPHSSYRITRFLDQLFVESL